MATITKRQRQNGVKYRVVVRLKGHPKQTATFPRLTDAKRWAADTESAIRAGKYFGSQESQRHTLADMLNRFEDEFDLRVKGDKEQALLRGYFEFWRAELGAYTLANCTPPMIAAARDKLLTQPNARTKKPLSTATVARYMSGLSRAFSTAVNEWEWIEDSPMSRVKKPGLPRGRVRYLSDDERERLLAACGESSNPVLYLAVLIALSTGMRKSELMNLHWRDVDLNTGRAVLHETKNGELRVATVTGKALELLREHGKVRDLRTSLVFPGKDPSKPIDLRTPWETALRKAKVEDFRWHDLRHSCASYLAANGASMLEIAEVLGHKTMTMTKRYSHLSESHVGDVLGDMTAKIFGE